LNQSSSDVAPVVIRSSPRVIAPDWAARVRNVPAGALFILLVLALIVVAHGVSQSGVFIGLLAVLVLFGGPVFLKFVNTRVVITPNTIEATDSIRRSRSCPRGDLSRLVVVHISILGPRFALTRVLFVDIHGRSRLNLQVDAWSDEQLGRIYKLLALPVEEISQPTTPRYVNRMYPGSASIMLRYWPAFAFLAFVVAFFSFGFVLSAVQH